MHLVQRKQQSKYPNRGATQSTNEGPYHTVPPTYTIPPVADDLTIDEFEAFTTDRWKVLKEIDNLLVVMKPDDPKYEARMRECLKRYLPLPSQVRTNYDVEMVRKDVISHYILRLVCRRPGDREWFLNAEKELLRLRLHFDNTLNRNFIEQNGRTCVCISSSEFELRRTALLHTLQSVGMSQSPYSVVDNSREMWYKVPFGSVLELVRKRRVFLVEGDAYVYRTDLDKLFLNDFRKRVSESLVKAHKHFGETNLDERISTFVETLPKTYVGKEYSMQEVAGREINLGDLDKLAMHSMPLCMSHLHRELRTTHHLKHMGRLQYGLFLKGIGLTLDQALQFWREELESRGGRQFDKEGFSYSIKHNYGQVGKRQEYSPYSCVKIIELVPGDGEVHGCPYRMWDRSQLKANLMARGLAPLEIHSVLEHTERREYTLACSCAFSITHPGTEPHSQTHPNRYFDASLRYYKEKDDQVSKAAKARAALKQVPTKTVVVGGNQNNNTG